VCQVYYYQIKLRLAKASVEDINQMRDFLFALEEKLNDPDVDPRDIGVFCDARFNSDCGRHFQRVLFGYETLVANACDPSLSYLDWRPEIKDALKHIMPVQDDDESARAI
jgi:hypothetical protein